MTHPHRSDKLYDLAFFGDLLIACVPHGADIMEAVRSECRTAGIDFEEPTIIQNVLLTDNPEDDAEIIYSGTQMGWLTDEDGRSYTYAVKANS